MTLAVKKLTTSHTPVFEKGKWYAITLNPSDTYQFAGKPLRLQSFKKIVQETLDNVFYKIDYIAVIELSEPLEIEQKAIGPRLHIHGRFFFKNNKQVKDFLMNGVYDLSRLGHTKLKTIDDIDEWDCYCAKQRHIINEVPFYNNELVYQSFLRRTKDPQIDLITEDFHK